MKNFWAIRQRGFTIVELLVVIVVIGILAAVTVVAYNGIQTRAENTKTVSAVGQYARALQIYASDNGTYPITAYPCLGPASATCANVTDTAAACNGAGNGIGNATFETAIRTILNSMPALSSQKMECGGTGKMYTGAFYYSAADGKTANIAYYLKTITTCVATEGLTIFYTFPSSNTTVCYASLPAL